MVVADEVVSIEVGNDKVERASAWAINQGKILNQMADMVKTLQGYLKEVKEEIASVKVKADLAHATAEEAMDRVTGTKDQINASTNHMLTKEEVRSMITEPLEGALLIPS